MPEPMRRATSAGSAKRRSGHAGVDDGDRDAEAGGEDGRRGAAGEEVTHHLAGDGLGIGRDALGGDPVVGGEDA